jgi:hypothetical protein
LVLVPSGFGGIQVGRMEVGSDSLDPVATWSPDGTVVVFQLHWDTKSSVYWFHYPRELARAYNQGGLEAYRREDFLRASRAFEKASVHWPDYPDPLYNRACVMALRGENKLALRLLERAIQVGGRRYRRLARRDADFAGLRSMAGFQQLVVGQDLQEPGEE